MDERNLSARITVNPNVMLGKPTIRGLRITVEQLLKALAAGVTPQDLLEEYPELEPQDLQMVISMDKDFGEMVYHSSLSHAGVLLLRLEAATGDEKAIIVAEILKSHSDRLVSNFCVFQNGRLRIRKG